jgi:hypothetical protein
MSASVVYNTNEGLQWQCNDDASKSVYWCTKKYTLIRWIKKVYKGKVHITCMSRPKFQTKRFGTLNILCMHVSIRSKTNVFFNLQLSFFILFYKIKN